MLLVLIGHLICEKPFRQQANGSSRAPSSSLRLSGTETIPPILRTSSGILTYSAKPPSILEPISFRLMQRLYFLLEQYLQLMQGIIGATATLEPAFILVSALTSLVVLVTSTSLSI